MRVVIIGAGPAGVSVAETLRQHDSRMNIVMVSSEPYPPYSPPAILDYYITGHDIHFWKGRDFPERTKINYLSGIRVEAISPQEHTIQLSDGTTLNYDVLVIATGSRLYSPLEGAGKSGIYNFKSLSSAEELLKQVREKRARSALIVGSGFIGVEVGLVLSNMGLLVTQLVRSRVVRRMLDEETSAIVLEMILACGIHVREKVEAIAFVGGSRVEGVKLRTGEILTADLIIAATGLQPNVEFLQGSGIAKQSGIIVDEYMRTNITNIYAAGDVAETPNRITAERAVHANFANAVAQGRVVAFNILGWNVPYEGSDSMNSLKHLDMHIIAVGQMEGEELKERRDGVLRKLYLKDDRIVGFRLVGDISAAGIYRTLMNNRTNVRPFKHRLLEPRFGMGYVEGLVRQRELVP